jgi:cell division transport system permease protein
MFSTAWTHIRRSPYQALSAILVLTLTFFVISCVTGILYVSESAMRYFESKPQVTFFLKDDAKADQVKKIINELKSDAKVAETKYVSKEEALKIYRKQFEKDPLLLEMVTSSILPASIEVSTHKVEDLQMIFDAYKNHPAIEEIVFQKDIVENLSKWTRIVRVVGLSYIGFHLLLSFLVIMTIIGMKIALKREEIEIMQLLGASRSYIRTPFILEGMIYGFVGSLISNVFSIIMVFSITNLYYNSIFVPNISVVIIFMAAMTVFGMVLGWLSSALSVLRFLK